MNITIENMTIDSDALPYFDQIFVPGRPSSLHINNCSIIDEDAQLIMSIKSWSFDTCTRVQIYQSQTATSLLHKNTNLVNLNLNFILFTL